MTRNEFQSTLYRTTTDMLDAIAFEWLSAGGEHTKDTQREFLARQTDEQLAAEVIDEWNLDQADPFDDRPSHMEFNEYTAEDLAEAFGRLRAANDQQ